MAAAIEGDRGIETRHKITDALHRRVARRGPYLIDFAQQIRALEARRGR